jgi:membrane-bound lytic murein transglycosylase D
MQKSIYTLLPTLLLLISIHVFGDNNPKIAYAGNETKIDEITYIDSNKVIVPFNENLNNDFDDVFTEKFDSLINDWYIKKAYNIDNSVDGFIQNPTLSQCGSTYNEAVNFQEIPDSVLIQRLKALNSVIDLPFNDQVKKMIEFYTVRIRKRVEIMLGMANYYFPMFEETLDRYQMPLEIKYMAIIESALNAKALSRAGASGLWQFMYNTGKMYGLEVTSYVDERRDPIKATDAAARHLKDLYAIYNDWHLVIAAYNCGPGNVNKAIARSGGKRDYWSIYPYLPRETRGYVPAFISATYVMNYYKFHNITPAVPTFQLISDTVMITDFLHLNQISAQLNIDIEMLRELNPMYKRDIIPASKEKPYHIILPVEHIAKFIELENEIFAHNREGIFPNNQIKEPAERASSTTNYVEPNIKGKTKIVYTVKSGDAIGLIADWYGVRTADVKYWNNLRNNMIKAGQKLNVYVPDSKADHYKGFNSMSFAEKQKAIGKQVTSPTTASAVAKADSNEGSYIYYTVRNGDNLWEIAKKYPGVSAEDIKSLNKINNTRGLVPGQKLKIMKKS